MAMKSLALLVGIAIAVSSLGLTTYARTSETKPMHWLAPYGYEGMIYWPDGTTLLDDETSANFNMMICIDDDNDGIVWNPGTGLPEDERYYVWSDAGMNGFCAIDDSNIPGAAYYAESFCVGLPGGVGLTFRVWVNGSKFTSVDSQDGYCGKMGATPQADGTYSVADSTFTFLPGASMWHDMQIPGPPLSDIIPPIVISTYPPQGTDVMDPYVIIRIDFNEAINITSVLYAIEPEPDDISASWSNSNKTMWINHSIFDGGIFYWANITQAKDKAGNPLNPTPYSLFFAVLAYPNSWSSPFGMEGYVYLPNGTTLLLGETASNFEMIFCVDADNDGQYYNPKTGEGDVIHCYSDEGINGYQPLDDTYIDTSFWQYTMQPGYPGGYNNKYKIWINGSKLITTNSQDGWCGKPGSIPLADGTYSPTDQIFTFPPTGGSVWQNSKIPGPPQPTFKVPVVAGWNLISVPLIPLVTALPTPLMDNDGDTQWTRAMWYDPWDTADHWKQYNSVWNPALNDLEGVDGNIGVWLYVTTVGDAYINVTGSEPTSTAIQLKAGWNQVGYPSIAPRTVSDTFWGTGADIVEVFDPIQPYMTKTVSASYVMVPGKGYWVHVNTDTVWAVTW
ncbi:MAG: Ig-like domain-containing protein [Methanobacteriota archaeon]